MADVLDKSFEPILYSENQKQPEVPSIEYFANTEASSGLESAAIGFYGGFGENFLNSVADTVSKPLLNAYSAVKGEKFLSPKEAKKEFGYTTKSYNSRHFYERLEQRKQNTKDYNALVDVVSSGGGSKTPFMLGNIAGFLADPSMIAIGFGVSNLVLKSARLGMRSRYLDSLFKAKTSIQKATKAEVAKDIGLSFYNKPLSVISSSAFIPANIVAETFASVAIDYTMQYSQIMRDQRKEVDHKSVVVWGVVGGVLGGVFGMLNKRSVLKDLDGFKENVKTKHIQNVEFEQKYRGTSIKETLESGEFAMSDEALEYVKNVHDKYVHTIIQEPQAFFAPVAGSAVLAAYLSTDFKTAKIGKDFKNISGLFEIDEQPQSLEVLNADFVRSLEDEVEGVDLQEATEEEVKQFDKFINSQDGFATEDSRNQMKEAKEFFDEEFDLISNIYDLGKNSVTWMFNNGLENLSRSIRHLGKDASFKIFSEDGDGTLRGLATLEPQAVGILFSDRLQSWFNSSVMQGAVGELDFDEFYADFSSKYKLALNALKQSGRYEDYLQNDSLNPRVFDDITEEEFMNFFGDNLSHIPDNSNIASLHKKINKSYSLDVLKGMDKKFEFLGGGNYRSLAEEGTNDTLEFLNNLSKGAS